MLVISRRATESLWIGELVEIKIISVRGNRVKLGVSAPSHVKVTRDELIETSREG